MARSLSQHLCEGGSNLAVDAILADVASGTAFFDSCCAFMPAFKYFRTRLSDYQGDPGQLPPAAKVRSQPPCPPQSLTSWQVAIATFCAIGARASPHSVRPCLALCSNANLLDAQAVLGISAGPTDSRDHPDAPLLNAGTRRQSACTVLLAQAHALSFEQGLMDEATIENLAALVALTQMSIFVELCVSLWLPWGWDGADAGEQPSEAVTNAPPSCYRAFQGPPRRGNDGRRTSTDQAILRFSNLRSSPPLPRPSAR